VLDEAVTLFGLRGWSGFSIEKVAVAAGVGKASIYLRWASKEDLLLAGLRSHLPDVRDLDTGTLHGDLLALARQVLDTHFSAVGPAARRLVLDSDFTEVLKTRLEEYRRAQLDAGRRIIARAVERGETSEQVSEILLLNVVTGAASSYASLALRPDRERAQADAPAFAEQLVDFVLAALRAPPPAHAERVN